jgi:hypothetical protein
LTQHDYWPQDFDTSTFPGSPAFQEMLRRIAQLQDEIQCAARILPAPYAARVDDDWLAFQEAVLATVGTRGGGPPVLATICLSGEALRSEEQVHNVLESAEQWPVQGFYIVPEHPTGDYFVDDPVWLANLLDLCAGLRLLRRTVVVGYCNQQELCLAAANVDAMASGSWVNVRSFPPEKFWTHEEEQKRRSTWYYCPQALSEFTIPFLDMAHQVRILDQMGTDAALGSDFAEVLFSGAQPSTTSFQERQAFRHYLACLRGQVLTAQRSSFRETVRAHHATLDTAEALLDQLHQAGVLGKHRDFGDILDVNRAALQVLENTRGFVLERSW